MPASGIYYIKPNFAGYWTSITLDVPGFAKQNHVVIQQWGWNGGANQQWRIMNVEGDLYTIIGVDSGKALDIPYGAPNPQLPVQQYTPHGKDNQVWRFETTPAFRGEHVSRPEYHRIFNKASSLAMDIPYGSGNWGVKLQQYTPHLGWNQTFLLESV